MLGYDYAREMMNKLGFDYMEFDDHHFVEDLQFEEAVPMLKRLQNLADRLQRNFGVKITNTFPVDVGQNELPAEEMFMSGRALFPLSIAVAKKNYLTLFQGNYRFLIPVEQIFSILKTYLKREFGRLQWLLHY